MHWKVKAKIQNAVSLLPSSASYATYYWLQRHFNGLRRINPIGGLKAGIETWKRIKEQGYNPSGKVFFEVGTGRMPLVPLSYWLMGAEKTITIDLNPYLKEELVRESLHYILDNPEEIRELYGSLACQKRLNDLLNYGKNTVFSIRTFLEFCQIDYTSPGNAAKTGLPAQSIDFHTSYAVFEHIQLELLKQIIEEGNRLIGKDGLFIHNIDYSDHFSHSDERISNINFLQYSEDEWERYAGNRFMYMNRLRHDDFIRLFESSGHKILEAKTHMDQRSQELLRSGSLLLDKRFQRKSEEILSITGSWIVSKKRG